MTLISLLLAALIGYWVSTTSTQSDHELLTGIASGVCFAATLIPAFGLTYKSSRLGTNIRTLSTLFFVGFAVSHFWFAKTGSTMPGYLIINGIALLVFLGIFYKLVSIKDI